jgi:Phosphotransferase enzyme family
MAVRDDACVSTTAAYPEIDYTCTVRRPRFAELPPAVQAAIGTASGSPVVSADDPPGSGFTGGFAAVVHLADGRSVFAKAGSSVNPHLVAAYAQEAVVLQQLPTSVPAPRFVGAANLPVGDVDEREWQVVVAEAVNGALPQPWTEHSVRLVHDACLACVDALTPAPSGMTLPSMAERFGEDRAILGTFPDLRSGTLELTWGQPAWLPDRYAERAELVRSAAVHLLGDTACHGDLRADNTVIQPAICGSGARAILVDWNWLMNGPKWTDFVGVLPLARADGVDVDAWVGRSPLTRSVDPDAINSFLATIAAYMLSNADQPVWPGGPASVRLHQRRYARTFLDWLGARRGWC